MPAGVYDQSKPTYTGQDNVFVVVPARKSLSDPPATLNFFSTLLKEHLPGMHWFHPHK
jgi:hypothetical protein